MLSDDETQKLVSDSVHSISTLTGVFPAAFTVFIIIVSYVSEKTAGVGFSQLAPFVGPMIPATAGTCACVHTCLAEGCTAGVHVCVLRVK